MNKQIMTVRIIDRAGGKIPAAELEAKMGAHYSSHTRRLLAKYGYIEPSPTGSPGAAGPRDYVLTDLGRQYAHTGEHPMAASSRLPRPKPKPNAAEPSETEYPQRAKPWVVFDGNQEITVLWARTREEAVNELVGQGASREGLDARPWEPQPPRKPFTNAPTAPSPGPMAEVVRLLKEHRTKLALELAKVDIVLGELER